MTLKPYDLVTLKAAMPKYGLQVGARGTVVMVYAGSSAIEVEFADDNGVTEALVTLGEADVQLVWTDPSAT